MSYLDQEGLSQKTWYAILFVGLLHIFMAYAFVSGLAIKAVQVITGPLETVNIEDTPEPEEDTPPPPPPKLEDIPPYVPPPDVIIEQAAPPAPTITTQTTIPNPRPAPPAPVAPPAPPAPPAPDKVATPRGNTVGISTDDYPAASRRAGEEGRTVVRVTINTNGRVSACQVIQSSGFERLDAKACEVAERRWRFNAAESGGQKIESTKVQPIQWRLEDARR